MGHGFTSVALICSGTSGAKASPDKRWCLTTLWQALTPAPAQQRMIDIGPPPGPSPTAGVFCSALGNLVVPTRICAPISGAMTYYFGAFASAEYDALLNA